MKIIFCLIGTTIIAILINLVEKIVINIPIKEEKSSPIYITKNIIMEELND